MSSARAHLIEVSVEATFQPLLQMYLVLPVLVFALRLYLVGEHDKSCHSGWTNLTTSTPTIDSCWLQVRYNQPNLCGGTKNFVDLEDMEMAQLDLLQFVSMLTSIVSLAWSFAFYKAAMKREALDFDVNPLGRIFLILSNLCMVTSRLTALVVFAYRCTAFLTPPPP